MMDNKCGGQVSIASFICLKNRAPFGFAGLHERWSDGIHILESCAIIVGEANELTKPLHDRLAIIVSPQDYDRWLDPGLTDPDQLLPLLKPYPAEEMLAYPVSQRVNNPTNDSAELVQVKKA